MIVMKCPRCGRAAPAADELANDDLVCYRCGCYLVIAEPAAADRRLRARQAEWGGAITGAFVGLVVVPLFGLLGGSVGMAIVGGIAGALSGVLLAFDYTVEALWWAVTLADFSWIKYVLLVAMVCGCIAGVKLGLTGELVEQYGRAPVLAVGAIGGFLLGGLLGALLGERSVG